MIYSAHLPETPLGPLEIHVTDQGLAKIVFTERKANEAAYPVSDAALLFSAAPLLMVAMEQIRDYLDGKRQLFDLPIDWRGVTPFQERVLRATLRIPYGQARTYGDLALELGQSGASRAVGMALGRNPLPIVIPCHRVMGNDGRLRGYSAPDGLNKKAWLLKLEGVLLVG